MKYGKIGLVAFVTSTLLTAQTGQSNILKIQNEEDTRSFFHYSGRDLPIISAHRGGSEPGFPENTILAFQHTLDFTPAMFETDPRVTSDNQLVVMHDATLDRTTVGHGAVKDLTLAGVQALRMKDVTGSPVATHPPSLDELIEWAKGKTILNLDIKDAPAAQRLAAVRQHNAFGTVLFTVHDANQAKFFYDSDHRSLLACVIFTLEQMKTYEAAGIPWKNIAIGYVGTKSLAENKPLYDALHAKGVMVMVSTAPSDDKLATPSERALAYRKVIEEGADILETDRPIEAAEVIKELYPKKSDRYRFWGKLSQ
ncbi:MAG TPA: glycerophosphodiester phosphodiesterase family protein [Edaphobacter sp.]